MSLTGAKAKLCRAYGVNLFRSPKYDKILARKPNGPGIHGGKRKRKLSQFGQQLRAKQIARLIFGISEKQFSKYAKKAMQMSGDAGQNLLRLLELRVDNTVLKSGLANSIFQARQMVNHGHFKLNGVRIYTPSIALKEGDKLEVYNAKKSAKIFTNVSAPSKSTKDKKSAIKIVVPGWLNVNAKDVVVEIVSLPNQEHFDALIDTNPIIEFYSR